MYETCTYRYVVFCDGFFCLIVSEPLNALKNCLGAVILCYLFAPRNSPPILWLYHDVETRQRPYAMKTKGSVAYAIRKLVEKRR